MKAAINSPPQEATLPESYLTACRFALEPSMDALLSVALGAGWKREQILLSMMMIAMDRGGGALGASVPLHS